LTGAICERIVQVHLNRFCNLACAHCYTQSGPGERELLNRETVRRLLFEAKDQGYEAVGFSGGEPFLYPWFRQVLEDAHDAGLTATGITNATVLKGPRLEALDLLDFVAVSVDGPEPVHNAIRRSPSAFARMRDGIEVLRDKGASFGIAHTVTHASMSHLNWVADFSVAQGASALQLHPLGLVGAAAGTLRGLDGEVLARTYLAALALRQRFGTRMKVHVDLFNLERLRTSPELVVPNIPDAANLFVLSDVINPLVIMSNGEVSPICHAMGSEFRLGHVSDGLDGIAHRHRGRLIALQSLCQQLLGALLEDPDGWPYVNWYELLERRSTIIERTQSSDAIMSQPRTALDPVRVRTDVTVERVTSTTRP
jgi:MoaA/NifB/PqqE/SkfB family radical SAM enzyme